MILGENKDLFLNYLDKYLIETNKKGKRAFIFGISIVAAHIILSKLIFPDMFKSSRRVIREGDFI